MLTLFVSPCSLAKGLAGLVCVWVSVCACVSQDQHQPRQAGLSRRLASQLARKRPVARVAARASLRHERPEEATAGQCWLDGWPPSDPGANPDHMSGQVPTYKEEVDRKAERGRGVKQLTPYTVVRANKCEPR